MSADNFNQGFQFTAVSGGVGTTVVKNMSGIVERIIVPGTFIGTINIHDASSATGTTSTSQILSMGIPATSQPFSLMVGVGVKNGILYQATGTPVVTIVWN